MGSGWSHDDASHSQPNFGEHKNPKEANPSSGTVGDVGKKASDNNHQSEKAVKAIHNLDAIIENADSPLDRQSPASLLTGLRNGVLLNRKRQKYWVDKMNKNCFMVYARDLTIAWAENEHNWWWHPANDASDHESIEVAELETVSWLEVSGKFDTKNLSPGTSYEVSIMAMVKEHAYGWVNTPVNMVINLPEGGKSESTVDMAVLPKEKWLEIPAGKFRTSTQNQLGLVTFSFYETQGGKWKRGLVVKGVKIQPAT